MEKITEKQMEIINGSLLGDGTIGPITAGPTVKRRLTASDKNEVIFLHSEGYSYKDICEILNISNMTVWRILRPKEKVCHVSN